MSVIGNVRWGVASWTRDQIYGPPAPVKLVAVAFPPAFKIEAPFGSQAIHGTVNVWDAEVSVAIRQYFPPQMLALDHDYPSPKGAIFAHSFVEGAVKTPWSPQAALKYPKVVLSGGVRIAGRSYWQQPSTVSPAVELSAGVLLTRQKVEPVVGMQIIIGLE